MTTPARGNHTRRETTSGRRWVAVLRRLSSRLLPHYIAMLYSLLLAAGVAGVGGVQTISLRKAASTLDGFAPSPTALSAWDEEATPGHPIPLTNFLDAQVRGSKRGDTSEPLRR